MSVNRERMQLLVDALLSGEYAKGTGFLHLITGNAVSPGDNTWCCIGVASDVACRNGLKLPRETVIKDVMYEKFGDSPYYFDPRVLEWYGFPESDGIDPMLSMPNGMPVSMSHWNDNVSGSTFGEIADGIKWKYLDEENGE